MALLVEIIEGALSHSSGGVGVGTGLTVIKKIRWEEAQLGES